MDEEDNLTMPVLVSPLDSEELVIARLKDIIKENELLLGLLAEIKKKKELHLAEIKKKKELHLADIKKKKKKLLLADIKKTEELLLADIKKKELLREVEDKKKKQRFLSLLAVLVASLWALLSAFLLGGSSAYDIFGSSTSHQMESYVDVAQCSECKTCYLLTSAAADEVYAILYGLLCCSVLQAAAAVLALQLAGGRRCRALAYAALAAATVGHCMHGRLRYLLLAAAAYPGDDRTIPGVLFGLAILHLVVDLLCFLFLMLTRDDEDGGKQA